MRAAFVAIISSVLIFTQIARAEKGNLDSMSLEELMQVEVVVGASKREQKTSDAPASVTIVTSEEIKRLGYRNMYEILNATRSFYNTYDRNYDYIGLRGLNKFGNYNTSILVTIDGHRINDSVYDTVGFHQDFVIDLELIERIEIIRGPASSLYGSNALFGVINVVTKKASETQGTTVSAEYGSLKTSRARAAWAHKFENGFAVTLSASGYSSQGQEKLYFSEFQSVNDGIYENNDYEKQKGAFLDISKGNLRLQSAFNIRSKGMPTGSYATVYNDSRNHTEDTRSYLNLSYQFQLEEHTNLSAQVSYDESRYYGMYIYDVPPVAEDTDKSFGQWITSEVRINSKSIDRNDFTVGVEYRDNFKQTQNNYYDDGTSNLNDKHSTKTYSLFAQNNFQFADWGTFDFGLRYDKYQHLNGQVMPRAALITKPDGSTVLKFIYGQAYRAPNAYELYYHDGGVTQKPADSLDPEHITNTEVSVERMISTGLRIGLHAFRYKVSNMIDAYNDAVDGLKVFRNQNAVTGNGIEFEADYKTTNGLRARLSFSNQRVVDEASGAIAIASPQNMAKADLTAPIWKNVFLGTQAQWISDRKTFGDQRTPAYTLTHLTLTASDLFTPGLESTIGVHNLFDRKFSHPVSNDFTQTKIDEDGRTLNLKMSYYF